MMLISTSIAIALNTLYIEGKKVKPLKWQSTTPLDAMYEVTHQYLTMDMPELEVDLLTQTNADMPWAEDHFQERVKGEPLNPGNQYKNWPYYRKEEDDKRFRGGESKDKPFSHSYMERYWPPRDKKGIRYNYGDLNHLIERIDNDPLTRQAYFSVWHPEDQVDGERVPCSLGYHFLIREGKMDLTYHIRSCDIRRHFKNDIYMTIRLAQWVAERLDEPVRLGNMYMLIGSLHCWFNEKEMLLKDLKV
jgi:thymidylate synthase